MKVSIQPYNIIYKKHLAFNQKDVCFTATQTFDELRCDDFEAFKKKNNSFLSKLVLSDDLTSPMKFKTLEDFEVFFDLYNSGKCRLLLMPPENGINNFATLFNKNNDKTCRALDRFARIVRFAFPYDEVFISESGSSEVQKLNNKRGIIPAHMHYIVYENNHKLEIENIKQAFKDVHNITDDNNILLIKNMTSKSLMEHVSKISNNGKDPYKFFAKLNHKNLYDTIFFLDAAKRKYVFFSQKVITKILYNTEDESHYNSKIIDSCPSKWSYTVANKIYNNRKINRRFKEAVKNLLVKI